MEMFLIVGFILAFSSILVGLLKELRSNKEAGKFKNDKFAYLAFIIGFIGIAMNLIGGWKSEQEKKIAEHKYDSVYREIKEREDSIRKLTDTINSRTVALAWLGNYQIFKSIEIIGKTDTSLQMQVNILREITGDNNKPEFSAEAYSQYMEDSALVKMSLENHSKYPLIGISVILVEIPDYNYLRFDNINLPPHESYTFMSKRFKQNHYRDTLELDFTYTIRSLRKSYSGHVIFKRKEKDQAKFETTLTK